MRPAVRDGGGGIGIAVAGREHTLLGEDVILTMKAPEGYSVEHEGAHAVALDLTIDDDLREDIERGLASGFADYWTKPIDFTVFIAALHRLFPAVVADAVADAEHAPGE